MIEDLTKTLIEILIVRKSSTKTEKSNSLRISNNIHFFITWRYLENISAGKLENCQVISELSTLDVAPESTNPQIQVPSLFSKIQGKLILSLSYQTDKLSKI